MKLIAPCNWDYNLIEELKSCNNLHYIYGKLNSDLTGGGRNSAGLPLIDKKYAEKYIKKAQKNGIDFCYLLNGACLDNREYTVEFHQELDRILIWLSDLKVKYITVANPYLLTIIKKCYPQFKVIAGQMCLIYTVSKAKYYEDLGADEITMNLETHKNFKLLENTVKALNIPITLCANLNCLRFCPFIPYHSQTNAHSSQSGHISKGMPVDYCTSNCFKISSQPEEFIKGAAIRPEDIKYYEKTGIKTLKIVGRSRNTEFIARAVKAYSDRFYNGNFLDLLDNPATSGSVENSFRPVTDYKTYNFHALEQIRDSIRYLPIRYVDNKKLEGFIKYFVQKKPDCENMDCKICGYCKKWADKVFDKVKVPEEFDKAIDMFNTREILNFYKKI